jgi:signal transduction histidine kinase
MTIRARLTFWYVGVMFLSLLAMVALSYREFVVEPRKHAHKKHEVALLKEVDDDQVVEAFGIVLWCGLPAALLAVGGGWWLMRKALTPVAAITQAAERISERNLREQLARSGNGDEFDRLTEVFNAMTARLNDSFLRIREFTLHASHELRTPLTVLRGELESQLLDEGLPEAQRECVASELDEVQRLSRIVEGLMLLTKADAGQISLKLEPLQLDDLVRDACADAQILAKPSGIKASLGVCEAFPMMGDRHRLRQLLLNLTDNAVKYNNPGGVVDIELRKLEDSTARITIANTGAGIPAEMLPRVFDRFFRGDPSHNNVVEGCGLGLSIAKWIVTAHSGSIQITSTPAEFTRVVVTLPKGVVAG